MTTLGDGKTYRSGTGRRVTIGGAAKDHPEYVWSIHGDWYERSSGKLVHFSKIRGCHFVGEVSGMRDLIEEVGDEDYSEEEEHVI